MYTLGLVPDQKVSAEFKMPKGRVLILVDDDLGLVRPSLACDVLVETLGEQLIQHKVTEDVVTSKELARLRRETPDFETLSIREVGRRADADIVLWISVEDFAVEDDLEMAVMPARFDVRLKVFNARAENKAEVRLWPGDRQGKYVSVSLSPHDVRACGSPAGVHRKLAADMADRIAKLFYDYTIKR